LVIGVVSDRDGERDAIGKVEPAEAVHVEARLHAGTRTGGPPAADRTAVRIGGRSAEDLLNHAIARANLAALRRKAIDGADRLPIGLVLLISRRRREILRQPLLQQVEVAGRIHADAAAVTTHTGNGRGHLLLLAANCL